MKKRFRGLRLAALVSKGIGWLVLIGGLGLGASVAQGSLYIPFAPPAEAYSSGALWGAAALFVPFLLGFLLFFGGGAAWQVLIAIEENTRQRPVKGPPAIPQGTEELLQSEPEGIPPDAASH